MVHWPTAKESTYVGIKNFKRWNASSAANMHSFNIRPIFTFYHWHTIDCTILWSNERLCDVCFAQALLTTTSSVCVRPWVKWCRRTSGRWVRIVILLLLQPRLVLPVCWMLKLLHTLQCINSLTFLLMAATYMAMASLLQRLFLESILLTPLSGSLRNFNICRLFVGSRTLWRDFWFTIGPQKMCGLKTTYFWRLRNSVANLRANISGEEHDIDNQETTLRTTKGPLRRLKISWTWSTNG